MILVMSTPARLPQLKLIAKMDGPLISSTIILIKRQQQQPTLSSYSRSFHLRALAKRHSAVSGWQTSIQIFNGSHFARNSPWPSLTEMRLAFLLIWGVHDNTNPMCTPDIHRQIQISTDHATIKMCLRHHTKISRLDCESHCRTYMLLKRLR